VTSANILIRLRVLQSIWFHRGSMFSTQWFVQPERGCGLDWRARASRGCKFSRGQSNSQF